MPNDPNTKPPPVPMPVKSFENTGFLHSASARTLRILSEYVEPRSRIEYHKVRDTIVFFGSARFHDAETAARRVAEARTPEQIREAKKCLLGSRYYEEARELSSRLTNWAREVSSDGDRYVICSGGGPGIMEAANRGAYEAGGRSIGLNISLPDEQQPNPYITPELCFQFHYFFMRKLWFAYLAKALLVYPGGFGTFDEMMEILTLAQTKKFRKKMLVVVYGSDYWDKVLNLDAMVEMGTISVEDRRLFCRADSPDEAFATVTEWLQKNYT